MDRNENQNPYQSPRATSASSEQRGETEPPSLLRTLLFGLYAGAIFGATAGTIAMSLVGFLIALAVARSPIAIAMGGAYFGCVAGGLNGAVLGSPLAGMLRWLLSRNTHRLLGRAICTGVYAIGLGLMAGMLSLQLTAGVKYLDVQPPLWNDFYRHLLIFDMAVGAAAGAVCGYGFARRVEQFLPTADIAKTLPPRH